MSTQHKPGSPFQSHVHPQLGADGYDTETFCFLVSRWTEIEGASAGPPGPAAPAEPDSAATGTTSLQAAAAHAFDAVTETHTCNIQ